MLKSCLFSLIVAATACKSEGTATSSKAEADHAKAQGRAGEIATAAQQSWTVLVDEVTAATAPPLADVAAAKTAVEAAKTKYLEEMTTVRKDVHEMEPSARGAVSSAMNKFQEGDAYKAKVKLIQERAQSLGDEQRELGEAVRELLHFKFVHAVHSEK